MNGFTQQEKSIDENLFSVRMMLLDKSHEYHEIDFLVGSQNLFGMTINAYR